MTNALPAMIHNASNKAFLKIFKVFNSLMVFTQGPGSPCDQNWTLPGSDATRPCGQA